MHKLEQTRFIPLVFAIIVLCYPLMLRADCALSINDTNLGFEGGSGANIVTFTVTKTGNSACSSLFSTSDETATGGGQCGGVDYVSLINGGLNFSATETSKSIVITTCGDGLDEADETFVINLHTPGSGATYSDAQGRATLIDDDPAPNVRINDTSIAEGNAGQANANFNVTLSTASGFTVTVDYATAANTATAGTACGGNTDFVTTTGTVTFNPGQTSKPVTVPVCGETTVESSETFRVNLSNPSHAPINDAQGIGTITTDDVQPNITINDVTRTEGNTGQGNATFTVSLSAAGSNQITVNFATAPVAPTTAGTACGNGTTDYVTTSGTLTFAAGSATPKTISVPVCGDTNVEANDLFRVNLSAATNANISDNQGQGTITNDDLPTLSIAAVQKNEGGVFVQTSVALTVTLSSANPAGASVNCVTKAITTRPPPPLANATGGSACASGTDFILTRSPKAVFGTTATTATCTVTVCGDLLRESDEVFTVELSNPQGATIGTGTAGVLIKNDD